MSANGDRPFFVGYKDMPPALRRFYLPLTVLLLAFSGFVGFGIASLQKHDGHASWDTAKKVSMEGLLLVDPYPVLHRPNPARSGEIESVLLVGQGKYSAKTFAASHHQSLVSVSGFIIQRGGWTMLELTTADDIVAVEDVNQDSLAALKQLTTAKPLGETTLVGEVADSKCFLGVMKPGAGSVHKACAEVCLLGGIPAMLIVRGPGDNKYGYILTDPGGGSAAELIAESAAEEISVSGRLEQRGDLLYLRMN